MRTLPAPCGGRMPRSARAPDRAGALRRALASWRVRPARRAPAYGGEGALRRAWSLRGSWPLALALLTLTACEGGPHLPRPDAVMATLVSPHGAEGAAVLVLSGEGLDSASVTGVGSTEVYGRADSASLRVLLVNQAGGTLSFELALPDVRRLPRWVVEEVAGPDDALRGSLAGYTVEFAR